MKQCPNCQANNSDTAKFCDECGFNFKKYEEEQAKKNSLCPLCGAETTGKKFCPECGGKKPQNEGWTCACGTVNKGKFCAECGRKRPAGAPVYVCDKCGWKPEDPANPPKFCPECGDRFDEDDLN